MALRNFDGPGAGFLVVLGLMVVPGVSAHQLVPPADVVGGDYFFLGLDHLWGGWDHLAFLAALVLPGGSWNRLLKVVTAFTIAHSLTLTLAATGVLRLPPSVVEPLIALTVVVVAVDALRPRRDLVPRTDRRFEWALVFGLIHGMGFAGALADVGIPPGRLAPALLGFNAGLEVAEVMVVLVLLPLVTALQGLADRISLRGSLSQAGSSAIAVFGSFWLVQRLSGGFV
jgi:hypothetical protein